MTISRPATWNGRIRLRPLVVLAAPGLALFLLGAATVPRTSPSLANSVPSPVPALRVAKPAPRRRKPAKPPWYRRIRLEGSLRGSYFTSSRSLDGQTNLPVGSYWLKSSYRFSRQLRLHFDGWAGSGTIDQGGSSAIIKGDLREAYLDSSLGDFDLAAGRIITVWGKSDLLSPTDNISPRNYRLLVPDDGDQRAGNFSGKVAYNFAPFRLTILWLPEFRANGLPIPALPPNVSLMQTRPDETAQEGALRLESTGNSVDWSLSYFNGFERNPDIYFLGAPAGNLALALQYNRVEIFGLDAATTWARIGWRAEAAYAQTQHATDPQAAEPYFAVVLGADHSVTEDLNVNVQYIYRQILTYQDPGLIPDPAASAIATEEALLANQLDRQQHGVSARIVRSWIHQTLETEIGGLIWVRHEDYLVRPRLRYALTDAFKLVLGADFFGGPAVSYFGSLKGISTGIAEIRWYF